jgi:chromate reductase
MTSAKLLPEDHMGAPFRILGIPGSLRRHSSNRALLIAAQDVAPSGVELTIYDGLVQIPLYNADVDAEGAPQAVRVFKDQIKASDALLIATPEYNYSIPGVLKNAIDWASRPARESVLLRKPVALMGAGGSTGTARSQLALRQVFVSTETYVLPKPEIFVRVRESFDAGGRLTDDAVREQIKALLAALIAWTRMLRRPDA